MKMMEMEPRKLEGLLARKLLTARIIWAGLMMSLLIYLGLAYALPLVGGLAPGANPPPVVVSYVLAALGIIQAAAGVMIYNGKLPFFPKTSGNDPEKVLASALGHMIMAWSFCETAGIMGLAIFLLFGDFNMLLLLCAAGAAGMFMAFPKGNRFEEIVRRKLGPDSGFPPR